MDLYTESFYRTGYTAEIYITAKLHLHEYWAKATGAYLTSGGRIADIRIDFDTIICDDIEVYEQELPAELWATFRRDAYDAMWETRNDSEREAERIRKYTEAYENHLFAKENNEYALYEYHKAELQAADQ